MAIAITEKAVTRFEKLKVMQHTPDHVLRVGVRGGGCSGLSYFLDIVEAPEAKDKIRKLLRTKKAYPEGMTGKRNVLPYNVNRWIKSGDQGTR